MSCPIEDIREYDIQRLLEYVSANSATYQEWSNRYLTATSATSAAIVNAAIGSSTSFAQISSSTLIVNGNILINGNLQTSYVQTSSITYNVANQSNPYLIAGTTTHTGATTNWGTYGIQHRIKTNTASQPRITVDSSTTELFTIENGGNVGIGISTPLTKLHVNGNIKGNGTISLSPNDVSFASLTTPATGSIAAGGTSVLPANPVGFLKIDINGQTYKLPFYGD
jgi:hypothetical protein